MPGSDCGAETSPSSLGVPGGEPEPAHPQQQWLRAVSDALCPSCLGIPSIPSLAWCCRSWGSGTHWWDAVVLVCAAPSCPRSQHQAVLVYGLEQRLAELGLPHSVPIPSASLGTSPSLCLADGLAAAGLANRGSAAARRLCWAVSTSRGHALGQRVPRDMGCRGTGACSLPVLPVPARPPTFLPGCSFSEFLGRATTANSLFLARVICTRWLCCVPTVGLWGAQSPSGPRSSQPPGQVPAPGLWEALVRTSAQPHVTLRSLLVAEEMRSLIVEKGPEPVEDDPDALIKGGCSHAGHRGLCLWSRQIVLRPRLGPTPEARGALDKPCPAPKGWWDGCCWRQ